MKKTYLVTGGAGFIGSNFIRNVMSESPDIKIVNLDKLTYSGNPDNLRDIEDDERYTFIKGDIADRDTVWGIFSEDNKPDVLINFAAETHVDRSISRPDDFIKTDIYGTFTLLEACRLHGIGLYVQISTDEVYGYVPEGSTSEDSPLMPTNPYSASKCGADRLAYSYYATYNMPVIITRASNNFGPYQYPEKMLPLFVTNALEDMPLPVYGDGLQIRDWLYVKDHCRAITFLIENGRPGEVYNIGGGRLMDNLSLTRLILKHLGKPESLIRHIKDRPGHDRRYSLNSRKIMDMGWAQKTDFETALADTIKWYTENTGWWKKIKSGEFAEYYKRQYTF